jgi:hypothetical protein
VPSAANTGRVGVGGPHLGVGVDHPAAELPERRRHVALAAADAADDADDGLGWQHDRRITTEARRHGEIHGEASERLELLRECLRVSVSPC